MILNLFQIPIFTLVANENLQEIFKVQGCHWKLEYKNNKLLKVKCVLKTFCLIFEKIILIIYVNKIKGEGAIHIALYIFALCGIYIDFVIGLSCNKSPPSSKKLDWIRGKKNSFFSLRKSMGKKF